jgi:hypothetical protein
VGAPAIERDWQRVAPKQIFVGDIIADFGLVQSIEKLDEGTYEFTNIIGAQAIFHDDITLLAFTAVKVA